MLLAPPLTELSKEPKLCEMIAPGYFWIASCSALLIEFPCGLGATTSTMFALGAIAWVHCTSRLVSSAQLATVAPSLPVRDASGQLASQSMPNDGAAGIPNFASNVARSGYAVGLPYA